MNYLIGFGRFWYDFIVGDSVTLAVGTTASVLAGAALAAWGPPLAGEVVLPGAIVAVLAVSLVRG